VRVQSLSCQMITFLSVYDEERRVSHKRNAFPHTDAGHARGNVRQHNANMSLGAGACRKKHHPLSLVQLFTLRFVPSLSWQSMFRFCSYKKMMMASTSFARTCVPNEAVLVIEHDRYSQNSVFEVGEDSNVAHSVLIDCQRRRETTHETTQVSPNSRHTRFGCGSLHLFLSSRLS
jgi:hypothetical protein